MLKILLSTSLLLMSACAYTQENAKFNLGTTFGVNQAYADLVKRKLGYTTSFHFDYQFSDYVSVGLEGQFGKILGGDQSTDPHLREFANQYKSVAVLLKMQLGILTGDAPSETLAALNKVYLGTGAGLIANNMSKIIRKKPDGSGYTFPGVSKSLNLTIPVVLGINVPIQGYYEESRFSINFNVQGTVTFGEGLDGYNDSSAFFANKSPDFYSVFSLGIRYDIGSRFYY